MPNDESDGFVRHASHSRTDGKAVRRSAGFACTAASGGFIDLSSCYTELLPCHDGVCFRVSLSAVTPNTIIHRRLLMRWAAVNHCTPSIMETSDSKCNVSHSVTPIVQVDLHE